jgi:hypothetical protein
MSRQVSAVSSGVESFPCSSCASEFVMPGQKARARLRYKSRASTSYRSQDVDGGNSHKLLKYQDYFFQFEEALAHIDPTYGKLLP